MDNFSIIQRAAAFAQAAHESIDQRRKFTNEPYINHPRAVADMVASVSDDANMIAAAWLHDVVEDTPIAIEQIQQEFGPDIANLVGDLTDVSRPDDGNRQQRLTIDRQHTAAASPRAKTVKLADIIHNCTDIARQNPGFARKYLSEKKLLLTVLSDGNQTLFRRAKKLFAEITTELNDL